MASIYKRKRIWWVSYNDAGVRVCKSTHLDDMVAAEQIRIHYESLENSYRILQPSLLSEWRLQYENFRKGRVSVRTLARDRQSIDSLFNSLGDMYLSHIKTFHIETWYSSILNSRLSPSTANCMLRTVKVFFNMAVRLGYLFFSPCNIKPMRVNEKLPRILSFNEADRILKVSGMWSDLIKVALYTGVRSGEICRLRTEDFDLSVPCVCIQSTFDNPTKSKKSRVIPIPVKSLPLFKRLIDDSSDGFLLHNANGFPLTTSVVYRRFVKCAIKAGVKCTFHDLRRTYGGWLVMSGSDLVTVQQNLGHTSIHVTIKHYANVLMGHRLEQVNKLPEIP